MSDDLSELLTIYAEEASEHLTTLNQTLLALETCRDPAERRTQIEALGRAAHSLKGASRAVGMTAVEAISHRMESVFDTIQAGGLSLSPTTADTLYDAFDSLEAILSGDEFELEPLLSALDAIQSEAGTEPPKTVIIQPSPVHRDSLIVEKKEKKKTGELDRRKTDTNLHPATETGQRATSEMGLKPDESIRVAIAKLDELMADASDLLVERGSIEQRLAEVKALRKAHQRWQKDWRRVRTAYIRAVRQASREGEWPVLIEFLNGTQRYMRTTGQQLLLLDRALAHDSLRISMIADSLQDNIRRVRLVPFDLHVATLQRTVRDVARQEDKEVLLQISGATLELDKRVLESIKDPLIHLLRNAVDHGIEAPDAREAAGKPREGTIIMAISQRGGDMLLLVADDGAGIDLPAVRQSAKRILSETEVDAMSDADALMLIMLPGLSTSEQVTTISGRGIGLDVVRENIEALQGRITVESVRGQGTTFRLVLPISLSTMRCMLARIGQETYAIPTTAIEQIVRVDDEEVFTSGGRSMITVDERSVGLATLADVIERPGGADPAYAMILASADRRMAFRIDDLITEQEMVVKMLNPELAQTRHVAGATLLGTGEVVIILNVSDLIKTAQGGTPRRNEVRTLSAPAAAVTYRILVVDDSITTRTLEKNILEAAGYEVLTAKNGLEALDILTTTACDLIVSDVEMPYMDGFELTARVRHSDRLSNLPVILVTSLDAPEQRERGLQVGANHYIVKGGFDQPELLETIRQLL